MWDMWTGSLCEDRVAGVDGGRSLSSQEAPGGLQPGVAPGRPGSGLQTWATSLVGSEGRGALGWAWAAAPSGRRCQAGLHHRRSLRTRDSSTPPTQLRHGAVLRKPGRSRGHGCADVFRHPLWSRGRRRGQKDSGLPLGIW